MGGHRRLAGYVIVDGTPYGPDDHLPERIAVRITNPAAWALDTPTHSAVSAPLVPTLSNADAADQVTAGRHDTAVPDPAVPNAAAADGGPADESPADDVPAPEPDMPHPAVPDEMVSTRDENVSRDITAPSPDTDEVEAPAAVSPPPRSGKGSGIEAWRAYARALRVPVPDGAERADIITACEKAGHLPSQ